MPDDKDLEVFVKRVAPRYPRSTIMLFGSRVKEAPYSDYDVAVILEKVGDRIRKTEEIITLKPERLPLDPLVLEVGDLEDPIIAKMLMPCRVLYDGLDLGIECVERPSVTDRKA